MARISRRSLLTSGAAAGVLAASGMALTAAPRQGGILRAAVGGAFTDDSWDSRGHSGLFMMVAAHGMVFDCLTEVGPDGALRGELAESWQASADARVWTFDLRKGVTFHNGKSFGADDVLETMALHLGKQSASPAAPLLSAVQDLRKLTDTQVQFHLSAPNADFPYLMADYHLIIYPAGYVELAMMNGIGTGLYRVENFEPGHRLRARRVSSHYKGASAGFFDEVELLAHNNADARTGALAQRDVDVAAQLPPQTGRDSLAGGVHLHRVSGNRHIGFALDSSTAPFDKADLRRALKIGIDRTAFLTDVLGGHGRIAQDSPIGPANHYFAADLAPVPHDPDHARYLLRRAGIDGAVLHMTGSAAEGTARAGAAFQSQMQRLGLTTDLAAQPAHGTVRAAQSSGRATEDWVLSTYLAPGAAWNFGQWEDPRFKSLLLSARSELDGNRRRALYRDLQHLLRDEGTIIVPAFADHVFATRDTLGKPATLGNLWALDNARLAERWWRV